MVNNLQTGEPSSVKVFTNDRTGEKAPVTYETSTTNGNQVFGLANKVKQKRKVTSIDVKGEPYETEVEELVNVPPGVKLGDILTGDDGNQYKVITTPQKTPPNDTPRLFGQMIVFEVEKIVKDEVDTQGPEVQQPNDFGSPHATEEM